MPLIFRGLAAVHPAFIAWRWALFIPGCVVLLLHCVIEAEACCYTKIECMFERFMAMHCPQASVHDCKHHDQGHCVVCTLRKAVNACSFCHIGSGIGILFFATDLPDGNYAALKKSGARKQDDGKRVFAAAVRNYRCAFASHLRHVSAEAYLPHVYLFMLLSITEQQPAYSKLSKAEGRGKCTALCVKVWLFQACSCITTCDHPALIFVSHAKSV